MLTKFYLILCAQAILHQCALSQRVSRGIPFGLGGRGWFDGLPVADGLAVADPWGRGLGYDNFGYDPIGVVPGAPMDVFPMGYEANVFPNEIPYMGGVDTNLAPMNFGLMEPMMPMIEPMMPMFDPMMPMCDPMMPMFDPIMPMCDPMMPMFDPMMPMCDPMMPMCEPMMPIYEPMMPMYEPMMPMMDPMSMMIESRMDQIAMGAIDPVCPIRPAITESLLPNVITPVEEIRAPVPGCGPNIAPSASLAVVVMDSSIQNLFENLWNVHQ